MDVDLDEVLGNLGVVMDEVELHVSTITNMSCRVLSLVIVILRAFSSKSNSLCSQTIWFTILSVFFGMRYIWLCVLLCTL